MFNVINWIGFSKIVLASDCFQNSVKILMVMIETGMRVGEVINLKIKNINFEDRFKFVTAKNKTRKVYFREDKSWNVILNASLDDNDDFRTDKEHVFHWDCYKRV